MRSMRGIQRLVLAIAWVMFAVSMFLPGEGNPPIASMSVSAMAIFGVADLLGLSRGLEFFDLFGMACFLVSPLILILKPDGWILLIFRWVFTCGLLLPWGVPGFRAIFPERLPNIPFGIWPLLPGFYLFACAQTLAFIACAIPMPRSGYPGRGFQLQGARCAPSRNKGPEKRDVSSEGLLLVLPIGRNFYDRR
jgi:hypothetical protein